MGDEDDGERLLLLSHAAMVGLHGAVLTWHRVKPAPIATGLVRQRAGTAFLDSL